MGVLGFSGGGDGVSLRIDVGIDGVKRDLCVEKGV